MNNPAERLYIVVTDFEVNNIMATSVEDARQRYTSALEAAQSPCDEIVACYQSPMGSVDEMAELIDPAMAQRVALQLLCALADSAFYEDGTLLADVAREAAMSLAQNLPDSLPPLSAVAQIDHPDIPDVPYWSNLPYPSITAVR